MTEKEMGLRKTLRELITSVSHDFKDIHGNDSKGLTITDVMRILLENKDIINISNNIRLLENERKNG